MRPRLLSAALTASALLALAGCAGASPDAAAPNGGGAGTPASTCAYPASGQASVEVTPPAEDDLPAGDVAVTLDTSAGEIAMTLDADRTPCTVGSFVSLAEQQYFDDTQCHRLTTQGIFVLQCGDPTATGTGGPGYRFDDELDGSETYPAGTVAMANAGPGTNGSQFFLVYEDTQLDPNYTVFGQLSPEGLAVVQGIAAAGTSTGGPDGPPADAVTITGVTIG
ncbi:peptidylprolyl isomerase [Microbacterium sp. LMI1-1-1.1]|uniref:peptidylprolyl isomerase n=1 Tax=unclassified Microbacterium TaxID=2609290 RepID=UPI003466E225